MAGSWNERYVAFARVNGRTPEQQAVVDDGSTVEFMIWITGTLKSWRKVTGAGESLCDAEHVAFTAWLLDLPTPAVEVAA